MSCHIRIANITTRSLPYNIPFLQEDQLGQDFHLSQVLPCFLEYQLFHHQFRLCLALLWNQESQVFRHCQVILEHPRKEREGQGEGGGGRGGRGGRGGGGRERRGKEEGEEE